MPEPRVRGPLYEQEIRGLIAALGDEYEHLADLLLDLYVNFFVEGEREVIVQISRYYLAKTCAGAVTTALAYLRGYERGDCPFTLVFHNWEPTDQTGRISLEEHTS